MYSPPVVSCQQKEQDGIRVASSSTVVSWSNEPVESRQYTLTEYEPEQSSMVALPIDFKPGPFDVICGRGKATLIHCGNCRFRNIIKARLADYENAPSKMDKSIIVSRVVEAVKSGSTNKGNFVKQIDDRWYIVENQVAREKSGQRYVFCPKIRQYPSLAIFC
jgi:hypothetical protein